MEKHKYYDRAVSAYNWLSFNPERRAERVCAEYDAEFAQLKNAGATEKDLQRFDELWQKWLTATSRCASSTITGGSKYPVERQQKRNEVERRRANEVHEFRAQVLKRLYKEAHPELRPIMSGDADAVARLEKELAALMQWQAVMKDVNAAIRAGGESGAADAVSVVAQKYGLATEAILNRNMRGEIGYKPYELSNNNANIRRVRERIEHLRAKKAAPSTEERNEGLGALIVRNTEKLRLQLVFDGKPAAALRDKLKKYGFKWAPSENAWQRLLNGNSEYALERLLKGQ